MKDEKFIRSFLQALENKEVIDAILKITSGNSQAHNSLVESEITGFQNNSLSNKIAELKVQAASYATQLNERKKRNRELEINKSELENENIVLKRHVEKLTEQSAKLEKRLHTRELEVEKLKNRFKMQLELHQVYLGLSDSTRKALNGIFKGESIEEFIFCGVQWKSIESLWDFIKWQLLEESCTELKELTRIFTYFLNAHNTVYESPLYALQSIKAGDVFDEDKHLRGPNSKISGVITEVLLLGYINTQTNKIVRKSIIRV